MISQNAKIHRNTFKGGVNKDFNKTLMSSEVMVGAANVSLVDNGVFMSVQNIKGTTEVKGIINGVDNTTVEVLAVFAVDYKIDGVITPCLVIFTGVTPVGF